MSLNQPARTRRAETTGGENAVSHSFEDFFGGGSRSNNSSTRTRSGGNSSYQGNRSSQGSSQGGRSQGFGPRGGRGFGRSGGGRGRFGRGSQGDDFTKYIKAAEINTASNPTYVPKYKFSDFAIDESLKAAIARRGFENPTPIQDQSINHILEGRDLLGIAETGTGKTAAFLIPLLDQILSAKKDRKFISNLIIVPTRELAFQIEEELNQFHNFQMNIFSVCCVGGVSIYKQVQKLSKSNHFIIGTPGRLLDLVQQRKIDLSKFNNVVLDEVDRMLDMGFRDDIQYLISELPEKKQSLFFSATMDKEIQPLVDALLKNPVSVSVSKSSSNKNIEQDVIRFRHNDEKIGLLVDLLKSEGVDKSLIFCNMKIACEDLADDLYKAGFRAEALHGDKNMRERAIALKRFKQDEVQILVATDVAARGLDIPNVSHVINFDVPENQDNYVHRIGRTGRGGKTGKAFTFVKT